MAAADGALLIVSPRKDDRKTALELLGSAGFPLIEASEAIEAVSLLETQKISLVVVFHRPSALKGDEFVGTIRGLHATLPILFISDLLESQILINVLRFDNLTIMHADNMSARLLFAAINQLKKAKKYDGSERRKFRRIYTKIKAKMGSLGVVTVLNLSAGGGFVATNEEVKLGEDVVIDLPVLGPDSMLTGKVVWKIDENGPGPKGIGIQFTANTQDQNKALAKYIFLQVKDTILK